MSTVACPVKEWQSLLVYVIPDFVFDSMVHQTFCALHRRKLGPEIMEAESMQVSKWIILKRAYLWIPSCVGCGAIAWNHLLCLCEGHVSGTR